MHVYMNYLVSVGPNPPHRHILGGILRRFDVEIWLKIG